MATGSSTGCHRTHGEAQGAGEVEGEGGAGHHGRLPGGLSPVLGTAEAKGLAERGVRRREAGARSAGVVGEERGRELPTDSPRSLREQQSS